MTVRPAAGLDPVLLAKRKAAAKPVLCPSLGGQVCNWIETLLCHGPGDVQGEPWVLDDEFRAFTWRCYEVYPRDHPWAGRRMHRRAFLSRPKGRAKSELAAGHSCVEALGPVRFDHWAKRGETDPWGYRFKPGEPVGAPVVNAEVLNVATEESQAGNTFDGVIFMLSNGAVAEEFPGLDVGLTRVNLPDGGVIEPLTAAPTSKDGAKSTFVVFDEVHLYVDPRLHRLYNTITRNITKRKIANGWALITSTMFGAGEGSVAEVLYADAFSGRKDSSLLVDHRQAPADLDIADEDQLRAGLEYVYGAAAGWTNIDGIVADEFHDPTKSEADNRRYWLNQPWKSEAKFFDAEKLAALPVVKDPVAEKTPIVVAFDGSRGDRAAMIGWTIAETPHRFTLGLWEPPVAALKDWRPSRSEASDRLAWAIEHFHVRAVICVPKGWYAEIQEWEKLYGDEKLRPFVQFDTTQPKRMHEACDRYVAAVSEKSFSTDGDPVVDRHHRNGETRKTNWGEVIVRGSSNEPIDGAVCSIVGFYGLSVVPPEPKKKRVRVIDLNSLARKDGPR